MAVNRKLFFVKSFVHVCSVERRTVKIFHSQINDLCTYYFFFVVSDLVVHQEYAGGAGVCNALILADKLEKQTFEQEQKAQIHTLFEALSIPDQLILYLHLSAAVVLLKI